MAFPFLKKYRKNSLSIILLMLSPVLFFFLPIKIFWIYHLAILIVVVIENKGIARTRHYPLLLFFIIPILWSLLYSVYIANSNYSIVQSLYYLLIPPIFIVLGMQYGRLISKEIILKYIIYSGTIGSIIFIGYGLYILGFSNFSSIDSLRAVQVWGAIMSVLSVLILLFYKHDNTKIIKNSKTYFILLVINILGITLTASRTYYLLLLVLLLIFLLKYKRKWFFIFSIAAIIAFIQILELETENMLILKIQNSYSELFQETKFAGYVTANQYYRAYESQRAFDTYKSGSEIELIFGHGLEKFVDLQQYILLEEIFRKEIAITHNGYPYILIKIGAAGLVFYFLFFIRVLLFFIKHNNDSFLFLLMLGLIISLLLSNYVIHGFFNLEIAMAWALLGAFIVYKEKHKHEEHST